MMSMSSLAPPVDQDLVFICGALRSGTTLLRLMLDGHPGLSNPGEMDFLFEAPPLADGVRDMQAYANDIAHNRVYQKLGLKADPALGYEDQIRAFVAALRAPGRRLSINVHRHFDRIPTIFPGARYVHLLRDPRDVAKSSIGMGWAGNVYHGVDHWIASERDFERLTRATPAALIHRMKNEDLIRAPEAELRRLSAFLGVDYDPAMLAYPERSTYEAPDPALIEQWKRQQSAAEIALVEGKVGDMLTARGYRPSGRPPKTPGAVEKGLLRMEDRAGRWGEQVRRYGLSLTLLSMIARRFPVPGLRDHVRRKMAPIALKYVK